MQTIHCGDGEAVGPSIVTIGKFDGVHVGHRALLRATKDEAARRGLRAGVLTFDRHPAEVLRPEAAPPYLTPLPEKLRLLGEAGMDFCVVLPIGDGVLTWAAREFVDRALLRCAGARGVVTGPDFQYGRGRAGTLETLRADGVERGFSVHTLAPVEANGRRVSSYAVRAALTGGNLPLAEAMLGRAYAVEGHVVSGRQLGRTLGFPTANMAFDYPTALPSLGIYAVTATWDNETHPAVASLGVRPTVETSPAPVLLEVHVLDWSGDLYGKSVRTTFVRRLRDEVRFESLDALTRQMNVDANKARGIFGRAAR
jgi:riboflavin kinase/FMN adenylyltransferase